MSIGNTKDKGNNYGNNYPYQLAVLKLLDQIATSSGGGSCPCPSSAQEATLSTRATEATVATLSTETTLTTVKNNVTSKMDRIRGSANYTRTFTYYTTTVNVQTLTHTGTTALGVETIVETFTYVNATIDGSNITSIVYS
jgi:hypothetical protein